MYLISCAVFKVEDKYGQAKTTTSGWRHRFQAVMPVVLQELMRHESIETTLTFYVGQNAERTADVLWAAHEHVYSSDYSAPTPSDGAIENPAATLGHSGT